MQNILLHSPKYSATGVCFFLNIGSGDFVYKNFFVMIEQVINQDQLIKVLIVKKAQNGGLFKFN